MPGIVSLPSRPWPGSCRRAAEPRRFKKYYTAKPPPAQCAGGGFVKQTGCLTGKARRSRKTEQALAAN
ncbi:hypothetical protein ASJ35_15965 [Ruthenibacterium lactatiformans]|uniref:Uncharacterized protein n=1 Tax=Ruthenibacterium lactatiformans TaxID=1550024 RepID=A0A0D8IVT7_9FIRM|nr:hypothetical protein TQ39_16155 [Ruthenibacterium lactatiformans]KUE75001.1 hypothetical protein ASJ35_15965 [Ruthenibacterium lactatiformans]